MSDDFTAEQTRPWCFTGSGRVEIALMDEEIDGVEGHVRLSPEEAEKLAETLLRTAHRARCTHAVVFHEDGEPTLGAYWYRSLDEAREGYQRLRNDYRFRIGQIFEAESVVGVLAVRDLDHRFDDPDSPS